LFVSDDDEDNQSSNSTHIANVVSESERESENDMIHLVYEIPQR
jgi:hypothetical protein